MNFFPRLDWANITLDDLDAVVIGHAHLDHTGFLPVLCKYGYKGPIYCTEPTLPMMNLIQFDAIKVASAQGRTPMYADRDVKQIMKQAITIPYGIVIACFIICFTSLSAYMGVLPCAEATLIASN